MKARRAQLEARGREDVDQEGHEDHHREDPGVERADLEPEGGDDVGHLRASAHAHADGERFEPAEVQQPRHAAGADDLADQEHDRQHQHERQAFASQRVEGDVEAEGDEEDRTQERIGDSFETVGDLLHQFGARDLFLEEQAREIGAENDVEADGLRHQPVGEPEHQHEGEPVPVPIAERVLEQREPPVADGEAAAEEQQDLDRDPAHRHGVDVAVLDDAEREAEGDQRHEVVDDAGGDDDPRHARVLQSEVVEDLEGDDDGRRGHREADEHGRHDVEAEREGDAETDAEGNEGPDDRHAHRLLQGGEELPRRRLDAGMEEQEEDSEIGEDLDDLVGLDPAENGGTQQDPHDQLAHDGRQADAPEDDGDRPDHHQQNQEIPKDVVHEQPVAEHRAPVRGIGRRAQVVDERDEMTGSPPQEEGP